MDEVIVVTKGYDYGKRRKMGTATVEAPKAEHMTFRLVMETIVLLPLDNSTSVAFPFARTWFYI